MDALTLPKFRRAGQANNVSARVSRMRTAAGPVAVTALLDSINVR